VVVEGKAVIDREDESSAEGRWSDVVKRSNRPSPFAGSKHRHESQKEGCYSYFYSYLIAGFS
jgi:hypothetical protein